MVPQLHPCARQRRLFSDGLRTPFLLPTISQRRSWAMKIEKSLNHRFLKVFGKPRASFFCPRRIPSQHRRPMFSHWFCMVPQRSVACSGRHPLLGNCENLCFPNGFAGFGETVGVIFLPTQGNHIFPMILLVIVFSPGSPERVLRILGLLMLFAKHL